MVQYFRVYAQLSFDEATKAITIERVFCERKNYWNDSNDLTDSMDIKSGSGGTQFYFKNVDDLGDDFVSLELFATKFFGSEWKVKMMSTASDGKELMQMTHLAKDVNPDDYVYGPWGMTVGVYQGWPAV